MHMEAKMLAKGSQGELLNFVSSFTPHEYIVCVFRRHDVIRGENFNEQADSGANRII